MTPAEHYGRGTITLPPTDSHVDAAGVLTYTLPDRWIVTAADGTVTDVPIDRDSDRDSYADALAVLGLKRRHAASAVLAALRDSWDAGDPWGSGMGALGAVCDLAYVVGAEIPNECGYRPGMGQWSGVALEDLTSPDHAADRGADVSYELSVLADLYVAGEIDAADLTRAARILNRYLDAADAAGRSY